MKKIAPELDSLMWTLAEEQNERAIDEFGVRHPELRTELVRRMAMVKGLRGEKKRTEIKTKKPIPAFRPRAVTHTPPPKAALVTVGVLVLAALAAASFTVTTYLAPPPAITQKNNQQPTPEVRRFPNEVIPRNDAPATDNRSQSTPDKVASNNEGDTILKPTTMKIEHAPLLSVLEMMSAQCGVHIVAAPGMPNPDVVIDYHDMNALEMLQDLGKQYKFTPLDQHDGSILVVPAIDEGGPNPPALSGNTPNRRLAG